MEVSSKPLKEHIDFIVDSMVKYIVPKRYRYVEADMLIKKLYRFLCGLPVKNENNLDIVLYDNGLNPNLITEPFDLIEIYVRKGVHKLTGVTYTEFKEMTRFEQQIFLSYVNMLIDEETIVNELSSEKLDELGKEIDENLDNNSDLLSGFNIGKDYI